MTEELVQHGVPVVTPAGGLEFGDEPKVLRFFFGKLGTNSAWPKKLTDKFRENFGDIL